MNFELASLCIGGFTKFSRALQIASMNLESPILIVIGAILGALIVFWAVRFLSPEARLERRRRKSNARIVSKVKRPTVKFSVRTPKSKR